jgi:hypothetical protein
MRNSGLCLFVSALVCVVTSAGAQSSRAPARVITVSVFFGDPSAAFIDPPLQESAKDLAQALKGKKTVRLVEPPTLAQVEVRIVKRISRDSGSIIVAPAPTVAFAFPNEKLVLVGLLSVGTYTQELTGSSDGSWVYAARHLASAIETWLKVNQTQLQR